MVEHCGVKRAVGLTLSKAQAEWINALEVPRVEVRVESWSDHQPKEPYNAIISIGAFEHFAKLNTSNSEKVAGYRAFFERCHDWLQPGGRLSLQSFAYGGVRSREDVRNSKATRFLAAEIFPETDPPRLADIATAAEGVFEIERLSNDRKDYAHTCREWLRRLRANREKAVAIVGEEVFSRFNRYLQLSTIGFDTGHLALYRITLAPLR
jgi:cyclopropane-fatty-acyl-phospholipid synthase